METSCVKDAFATDFIIGACTSHRSLASHVGIGSSSHCLFSVFLRIWDTSSTVTLLKLTNGGTCRCSIVGARAVVVVARMVSTFPVKKALKSSSVWWQMLTPQNGVTSSSCSRATSSQDTCRWLSRCIHHQYVAYTAWNNCHWWSCCARCSRSPSTVCMQWYRRSMNRVALLVAWQRWLKHGEHGRLRFTTFLVKTCLPWEYESTDRRIVRAKKADTSSGGGQFSTWTTEFIHSCCLGDHMTHRAHQCRKLHFLEKLSERLTAVSSDPRMIFSCFKAYLFLYNAWIWSLFMALFSLRRTSKYSHSRHVSN